ncbi:MAG: ABC transporter permease [Bdellovibrionaceae bacterium]|nr:ABC transporter permease [Pseudobdellovibrionaceae bacterium]
MVFLNLALKSLKNRMYTSLLTVLAIALSVVLLLAVERARRAAEDGFTQTISQTDLIVGARTGPVELILYTVFNIGNASHNISYTTYQEIKKHPAVEWTIPYSLGDGHHGFRVVGTNLDFFNHYRFRGNSKIELAEGKVFSGLWDVVVGADVAKKLKYKIGDKIVVAHGVTRTEGVHKHDDKPFTIVGLMAATGTALDQSLYVSLEAIEGLHKEPQDEHHGEDDHDHNHHEESQIKIESVTAFFLRTKSRIETLQLQREINTYKDEPLLAIIPGVTLNELWRSLSYLENVLKVISWLVVGIGFMAMLIALTTSLNERRREMAILRAIGGSTQQILFLLIFESTLLTLSGVTLGILVSMAVITVMRPWLEVEFGFYLVGSAFSRSEMIYLAFILLAGVLVGFIPALRAQKISLKDGLSVNT